MTDNDARVQRLRADDAEAFSLLRREVTAENPVPMGLTLEEELTRSLQAFRQQLSYPEPNAAFGALIPATLGALITRGPQYAQDARDSLVHRQISVEFKDWARSGS